MGAPTEQGHGQEPRGLFAQFVAVCRELPDALPGMLTPKWMAEAIAEQERCRQHGMCVGLLPEQVDEVMDAVSKYNRHHFAALPEEIVKERLTAYALGQEWRLP